MVLYWDFDLKSWFVDFFTCFTQEKTPQNEKWMQILRFYQRMKMRKKCDPYWWPLQFENGKSATVKWKIYKKNWLRSFTSTLQKCQPSLIWLWWAAIVMTRRHFYIIFSLGRKYLKNGGRHYYKLVHRNNLIPLL